MEKKGIPPLPGEGCLFCGSLTNKRTREDAWPRWLNTLFPDVPEYINHRVNGTSFDSTRIDAITRRVCKDCNNGWMSKLEGRCKPFLAPMILGQKTPLDERRLSDLAVWAMKTSITLEYADTRPERYIPESHCRFVHRHQALPPGVAVAVGAYVAGPLGGPIHKPTGIFVHAALVKGPPGTPQWLDHAGYSTVIIAGRLLVNLRANYEGFSERSNIPRALIPVWPSPEPAHWPPPQHFDQQAVRTHFGEANLSEPSTDKG